MNDFLVLLSKINIDVFVNVITFLACEYVKRLLG